MLNLKELITDTNGSLSHTKLWANIANFTATYTFIYSVYRYPLTPELLAAYVASVGLQRVASKYLDIKAQGGNNNGTEDSNNVS